jgi:large subunit ribosomal protein L12
MEYLYGALLLHKLGKEVNEENLKKVIAATGVEVDEGKVNVLIASLQGVDISAELENASAVSVAAGASSGGDGGGEAKEEEKEEEKPAESAAGLGSLFG